MRRYHWNKQIKIRFMVFAFTGVFSLVILLLLWFGRNDTVDLFHINLLSPHGEEQVSCWRDPEGKYYVFLPGYAELSDAQIRLHTESTVRIDDRIVYDGMSCDSFSVGTAYPLVYASFGEQRETQITFVQSAGVPTIYIDTESGSMGYIHDKKGNEESGEFRLYTQAGEMHCAGSLLSINGRGNATWEDKEKKPYSIMLSEEADLLGMGKAQKWVLLANGFDASNLRNKVVYEFAKEIGLAYSPESQWVDLYLNGEYAGLYLLCERNEVHPERVDISEDGGFLVSMELEDRLIAQNYPYVATQSKQALRIHAPVEISDELRASLTEKWQSVENAILAEDGIDRVTGKSWLEQIDLDSWAKKYLMEEIFDSIDAGMISQYFYCDGNDAAGKIFAGPVWDFDISMGSDFAWELCNPRSFHANQLHDRDSLTAPWFYSLYQKEAFYDRITELYQTEFLPVLERWLHPCIRSYAEQISQASVMNQLRWSGEITDFYSEVECIVDYMPERIAFLSSVWCDRETYCLVRADYGYDCCLAVPYGECLTELYEFEDTKNSVFLGWYYKGTDEPFDLARPITEDIEIYAKWEEASSEWVRQAIKLLPLGVIGILGFVILLTDIKRMRKSR